MRFLVVDDSGINRRVAAIQLEHQGHEARTAADGLEALAMLQRERFDCVLMDVQMPVMDGIEATRRIREQESRDGGHLPILAMTAAALAEDVERCRAAGMDDCVAKPLEPREAVTAAARVMAQVRGGDTPSAPVRVTAPDRSAHRGRMSIEDLERQRALVSATTAVRDVLARLPQPVFLVGRYRQIVYANPAAAPLMPAMTCESAVGQRPGEALGCRHSSETAGGCGTTKFCVTCGAAKVLRAGQRREYASEECRIAAANNGQDRDLRVWAAPINLAGEFLTMFTVLDISDQKRRQALEQLFFHDVLNTAGGIQGLASVCWASNPGERQAMADTVVQLTRRLIDELRAQQALAAAEHGELQVRLEVLSSRTLLTEAAAHCRSHEVARERTIVVAPGAADVALMSDATLLGRVLGNMTKNALEACPPGGVVTLDCLALTDRVTLAVHNPAVMPRDVQLQLFQRSFSTKGPGRGLGTYSMRLLTERYLGGAISFSSSPAEGTTFAATYPIAGPPPVAAAAGPQS